MATMDICSYIIICDPENIQNLSSLLLTWKSWKSCLCVLQCPGILDILENYFLNILICDIWKSLLYIYICVCFFNIVILVATVYLWACS